MRLPGQAPAMATPGGKTCVSSAKLKNCILSYFFELSSNLVIHGTEPGSQVRSSATEHNDPSASQLHLEASMVTEAPDGCEQIPCAPNSELNKQFRII